jgi:hypothetical protein
MKQARNKVEENNYNTPVYRRYKTDNTPHYGSDRLQIYNIQVFSSHAKNDSCENKRNISLRHSVQNTHN